MHRIFILLSVSLLGLSSCTSTPDTPPAPEPATVKEAPAEVTAS
jgi:hypothetical protein